LGLSRLERLTRSNLGTLSGSGGTPGRRNPKTGGPYKEKALQKDPHPGKTHNLGAISNPENLGKRGPTKGARLPGGNPKTWGKNGATVLKQGGGAKYREQHKGIRGPPKNGGERKTPGETPDKNPKRRVKIGDPPRGDKNLGDKHFGETTQKGGGENPQQIWPPL